MITYDLVCDYCGTIVNASGRSAAHARKDARDQALIFKHGRNEYCKACVEQRLHLRSPQETASE